MGVVRLAFLSTGLQVLVNLVAETEVQEQQRTCQDAVQF